MRVEIYFNLHKKVFSMRHKGKVIAHVCNATLKNVTYVVQPAGRARVLREGKKNVHAFARGELIERIPLFNYRGNLAKYNPYKAATFHAFARGELVEKLPVYDAEGSYVANVAKYNPYKAATFVDKDDEPLYKSDIAYLALHSDTGKPFISTFNVEIDDA